MGGLPGLALEEHNTGGVRIVGKPPRREEGHWREGFIVLPVARRAPKPLFAGSIRDSVSVSVNGQSSACAAPSHPHSHCS